MGLLDQAHLPFWVLLLMISVSTASIALLVIEVWCRCANRSKRLGAVSPGISEPLGPKMSIRRGQLVPASSKESLTGWEFESRASHRQSRSSSHSGPEAVYYDAYHGQIQEPDYQLGTGYASGLADDPARVPRYSWSDLFQRESSVDRRTSARSTDEEWQSTSSTWDSVGRIQDGHLKQHWSDVDPPCLNLMVPLSPAIPGSVTLTSESRFLDKTSLQLPLPYRAVPPPPCRGYLVCRCPEIIGPDTVGKGRHSNSIGTCLSSSGYSSQGYPTSAHRSAETSDDFLHAWSSAYHDWLAPAQNPCSSAPVRQSVHVEVVSISDLKSEAPIEPPVDIHLPSAPTVSRINSFTTSSTHSGTSQNGGTDDGNLDAQKGEVSWLVDD